MPAKQPVPGKKYFTVAQANAALPLAKAILKDIAELAGELHQRHERLSRLGPGGKAKPGDAHQEELQQVAEEFERDQERIREYVKELTDLGIELKDPISGLIDFPCWMDNREVYLCWQLCEPSVDHWNELDAGFKGRQHINAEMATSQR